MIDKAIYEHLSSSPELAALLTTYDDKPAVFNQEAPADTDPLWADGAQYGRVIFAFDVQGDSAREIGGILSVDVQCLEGEQYPEELELAVRKLIDGYFFSCSDCTMAAKWEDSRYFTEPQDQVIGATLTFAMLAFPIIPTITTDVTGRLNEWTAERFPELLVINHDTLPDAWKPEGEKCAVYWRIISIRPAGRIPNTHQTIWRTATLRCHVFAPDICKAALAAQKITLRLYSDRRLVRPGESQIMVDSENIINTGADALREGQIQIEATYGEIVRQQPYRPLKHINYV